MFNTHINLDLAIGTPGFSYGLPVRSWFGRVRQLACLGLARWANSSGKSGFTLVELLVVIAIIGILIGLPAAGHQCGCRGSQAARASCLNNMKTTSPVGVNNFVSTAGDMLCRFLAGKYDCLGHVHPWTELVLPYIEQKMGLRLNFYYCLTQRRIYGLPGQPPAWGRLELGKWPQWVTYRRWHMARTTFLVGFYCPSDNSNRVGNELASPGWSYYRSSYRGCTGSGDMYGKQPPDLTGDPVQVWGIGAWGIRTDQNFDAAGSIFKAAARLNQVTDGTSKTLLLSEGLICHTEPNSTWAVRSAKRGTATWVGACFRQL